MSIILEHVSFGYGKNEVLKDLSLTISDNSHTVILGRSGCGKTTLLKLISGKEKPNSGSIRGVEGKTLSAVFQEDRLIEHLDAFSNVKYVLKGFNVTDEAIAKTLNELGITQIHAKPVREFSGGMKRRVAICRALLYPSEILIMDEPFRSLDYNTSTEMLPILKRFFQNRIVISVLHQEEIATMLDAEIIKL